MACITDILSAFIWALCAVAPWLLAYYFVASVAFVLLRNTPCPCPGLWHAVSGAKPCIAPKEGRSRIWAGLEYGLSILPNACLPQMLLGMALAAGILLTVPWDYTFYEEHPLIESLEFIMLVLLAILMRLPACASLAGALALLAKGFSPGLALLFLLSSPAAKIACSEREPGVSRASYLAKTFTRLCLMEAPLLLIYLLLGALFPSVRHAGRLLGPPVLAISFTGQICGAMLCAIMLRLAMQRLINKNTKATK